MVLLYICLIVQSIIFVKTNIYTLNYDRFKKDLKNRGSQSKLLHLIKIIYSYVTITCTNKKNYLYTITSHVVKIDILTGHGEKTR